MAKNLRINLDSSAVRGLEVLKTLTGKSDSENIEDAVEVWLKCLLKESPNMLLDIASVKEKLA